MRAVALENKVWRGGWDTFFSARARYSLQRAQSKLENIRSQYEERVRRFWVQVFKRHMEKVMPLIGQLDHLHAMSVNQFEASPQLVDVYDSPAIREQFRRLGEEAARSYAQQVSSQLNFTFHGLPDKTDKWLDTYIPKVVDEIGTTTSQGIINSVYKSIKEGESLSQTEARIRQTYDGWINSRPATIARTEVGAITMTAANDLVEDYSKTAISEEDEIVQIWLTANDERVRDSHRELEGEERLVGESFLPGASLMFPNDPQGPPEETINCRCVLLYEVRPKAGEATQEEPVMQQPAEDIVMEEPPITGPDETSLEQPPPEEIRQPEGEIVQLEKGKSNFQDQDFVAAMDKVGFSEGNYNFLGGGKITDFLTTWNEHVRVDPEAFFKRMFKDMAIDERSSLHVSARGGGQMTVAYERTVKGIPTSPSQDFIRFTRTWDFDSMVVSHDIFKLGRDLQGTGIGKQVLANSMDLYESVGIKRIDLFANIDVGGYAWAKYGFLPLGSSWNYLRSALVNGLNEVIKIGKEDPSKPRLTPSEIKEIRKSLTGRTSASPLNIWDISDNKTKVFSRYGELTILGRALLIGEEWSGFLDLKNTVQMERFDKYTGRKSNAK